MRIGLLIYDLRSGGAERVLCKWSQLLSREHEVFLYIFDGASKIAYDYGGTLRVIPAPSKGRGKLTQITTLARRTVLLNKFTREDKLDLLISFFSTANFPTMLQKMPRMASIRLYTEYFSYQKIYRFLIRHTKTGLIVQTERLKADILKDVGDQYAHKIHVIGNPLDLEAIAQKRKEEPEEAFLQRITGKKVICFTASFKTAKNHWNLIKSFSLVHKKHPDTVLVLIGGEGELETHIRQMAVDAGLEDAIVFVGKTQNPFQYEKYADVFVLPSLTEGIPNVLIEALAVGLPVIATDCPSGPREILLENPSMDTVTTGIELADYGILVEPFSDKPDYDLQNLLPQTHTLAEAMERILTDEALNAHYRQQAQLRAGHFSMEEYAATLSGLVQLVDKP